MNKEQSVLTKIKKVFASEKILPQYYVLGYIIDFFLYCLFVFVIDCISLIIN